jgi:hypothetical protein
VHLWHRGVENNERCGCGEQFHACPFWREVGQQAFGGWDRLSVEDVERLRLTIDRSRHIPAISVRGWRPRFATSVHSYTEYYVRLYRAISAVSGSNLIIDSSKHPSLAYCLATRPEIDLRVVHMVRDPRAVAYSWSTSVARPESEGTVEARMRGYAPERAASLWNTHNAALWALRKRGTPTMLVRYEDFVTDPTSMLTRLRDWSGLPVDESLPVSADGRATLHPAHTASGNPMRFRNGEVSLVLDSRWRTELSPAAALTVTAITLPLLRAFRYPVRRSEVPR